MKKPFKVLTTSTMAAILGATALTPVVSVQAEEALTISEVVFQSIEGPLGKVEMETYNHALAEEIVNPENVKHIHLSNGKTYSMEAYNMALAEAQGDKQQAIELLAGISPIEDEVLPGKILNDGTVTVGEQPEDRLNETFFYNVA